MNQNKENIAITKNNVLNFNSSYTTSFSQIELADEATSAKFGYRTERLYQKRLKSVQTHGTENDRLRLFQFFTDYQYLRVPLEVDNKNIVLTCVKAGGCGDVAHTFRFAEFIRQKFPDYKIKIVVNCPLYDSKEVKALFPTDRFDTQFLSIDYYEKENQLIKLRNEAGCLLGIAVPVISPELAGPTYRTLREYGYGNYYDTKGHNLSMGLAVNEEGLNLPSIKHQRLCDLETSWLKQALEVNSPNEEIKYHTERSLYHMYIPTWSLQIIALYSIAAIEKQSSRAIDIALPLSASLNELIAWGALQLDYLKNNNIGKIVHITPQGIDIVELGTGKIMQIISGKFPKNDMEIIEEYSQPFFGCTGDMSRSAAFVRNKLAFYANTGLKDDFVHSENKIISERGNFKQLEKFQDVLARQSKEEDRVYTKNTPRKRSFYQPDPSMKLSDPNSIPRKSMSELAPSLPKYADEIAHLYLNTNLLQEAQSMNAYIVANFNIEPRFMAMVHRGLILTQYPELIKIENELWDHFNAGHMTEEDVVETLNKHISNCLISAQTHHSVCSV